MGNGSTLDLGTLGQVVGSTHYHGPKQAQAKTLKEK